MTVITTRNLQLVHNIMSSLNAKWLSRQMSIIKIQFMSSNQWENKTVAGYFGILWPETQY